MNNIPQIIEVEHCGANHLSSIYSICETPLPGFPKPEHGGLWTSPVNAENSWRNWCLRENWHIERLEKHVLLQVETSKLLIIDSLDDLMLKMVHPRLMEIGYHGLPCINWKKVTQMYNGIWLTTRGERETRYSRPYSLYGWDCETVFLFNEQPIIKPVQR